MKHTVLAACLLALVPSIATAYPEKLGNFDTFIDWEGYEPVYFAQITGLPIAQHAASIGDKVEMIRGTVGLSYNERKNTWVLVVLREVKTIRPPGARVRIHIGVFRQIISIELTENSSKRLRLKEEAPAFSLSGERATRFKLNKGTMTGSVRMKFWHGGRLSGRPYSDRTYNFKAKRVERADAEPAAPGGSLGAAGIIGSSG